MPVKSTWTHGSSPSTQASWPGGMTITSPGPRGERIRDDSFLVLINASPEPRKWSISGPWGDRWHRILDTTNGPPEEGDEEVAGEVELADRSILVLRRLETDADG